MRFIHWYLQILVCTLGLLANLQAQSTSPYITPLDIPVELSGSFSELRNDHFHGGIDYRTQQREGLAVRSIADGFIYRIGISPSSYGKVLYLKHANCISIYGHLSAFPSYLDSLIRAYQYAHQSNEIDWILEKTVAVSQGDTLAFSGNSGNSGGPHLHFEIRDTSDTYQINPCLLGLCTEDNQSPSLLQFALYPLSPKAQIYGLSHSKDLLRSNFKLRQAEKRAHKLQHKKAAKYFKIDKQVAIYSPQEGDSLLADLSTSLSKPLSVWHLQKKPPIKLKGIFGFGIEALDKMDHSPFNFGLYRLGIWLDTQCIYSYQLDRIPLAKTNRINAHIDYPYFVNTGHRIEHSQQGALNDLELYTRLENQGRYDFSSHGGANNTRISILCEDFQNNVSLLQVHIQVKKQRAPKPIRAAQQTSVHPHQGDMYRKNKIIPQEDFVFSNKNFSVFIPANSVFDTVCMPKLKKTKASSSHLSPFYEISLNEIPLKQSIDIGIAYPPNFNKNLLDKLLIIHLNKNKKMTPLFSTLKGEKIHGISQKFGTFVLEIDTIAPKIESSNLEVLFDRDTFFTAHIQDALSGIYKYEAYLNGQWLRLYYDKKNNTLYSDSWAQLPKAKYELRIYLEDAKNNKSEYIYNINL
ncbi:MAG: M23 family metallopeptidase [Bacteroidales bacterium]